MYSPLRGMNDKWTSQPGYTNFGELSDLDKRIINYYTGDYSPTDIIWGTNELKGFARRILGRDPYAVNNEFLKKLRQYSNYAGKETSNAYNASNVGETAADAVDDAAEAATGARGSGGGLKGFFRNFNEGFGGKPFKLNGKTLGSVANKAVTYAPAAIEGFKALGNLSDYDGASDAVDDYVSKINALASGTPMLDSYLTADQLSQLRKLQRGSYDTDFDMSDAFSDPLSLLKGAGQGALTGLPALLTGNPIPLLIGAGGGAINAGIQNATQGYEDNLATLEELYNALQHASQDYKSMRRPNFQGLGIQQRYQDMYR